MLRPVFPPERLQEGPPRVSEPSAWVSLVVWLNLWFSGAFLYFGTVEDHLAPIITTERRLKSDLGDRLASVKTCVNGWLRVIYAARGIGFIKGSPRLAPIEPDSTMVFNQFS